MAYRRRFVRRRVSRGTRGKRKTDGDWIVLSWSESPLSFSQVNWDTGLAFPLLTNTDLVEHDENVTIQRIVGTIHYVGQLAAGLSDVTLISNFALLDENVTLVTQNLQTGGLSLAPAQNIGTFAEGNRDFMWYRSRLVGEAISTYQGASYFRPSSVRGISSSPNIDIRVKRIVKPGMALAYNARLLLLPAGSFEQLSVVFRLRAYVKF